MPLPEDGNGLAFPLPKGLDCEPFPLSGEFAEELGVLEWFSATAAPAPAAAASTATAT